MNNISTSQRSISALSSILIIFGLFLIGSFLGSVLVLAPLAAAYGLPFTELERFLDINQLQRLPEGRLILFLMQAGVALFAFILSSIIFLKIFEQKNLNSLNTNPSLNLWVVGLTAVITIVVMPFSSLLIEWNAQLKFPAFMAEFEKWASQKEETLKGLTLYLTNFQSVGEFLLGLLVVAVIPAIGEELLFRGLVQRKLSEFINVHLAIWLTGIIFSAIHLQFYGFVPRMLLGVLFGYFYFWSGNLWLAIIGHFVNNAFTLSVIYFSNLNKIKVNIESQEAMPMSMVMVSVGLTLVLLYIFPKNNPAVKPLEN
ncbi:MAG: CPBP family intramembrane metalloprotease [Microscillaceae bacterium]|nr:CPBP family intramembrane metalloprotease [Microscillaceae bacterium]